MVIVYKHVHRSKTVGVNRDIENNFWRDVKKMDLQIKEVEHKGQVTATNTFYLRTLFL